jgi:hypothetical protein
MKTKMFLALGTIVLASAIGLTLATNAKAGPEKIAFPERYQSQYVVLGQIDRYENKTIRKLYVNPEAYGQVQAGRPLPDGTTIILEVRPAKLKADGNPELDSEGRFIATDTVTAVNVQKKQRGWGTEYPASIRNGEWEYAVFDIDGKPRANVNTQPCLTCHQPREKEDYTFVVWRVLQDVRKRS